MRSDFSANFSEDQLRWSEHERAGALARLVPLWPSEIADTSRAGRTRIVAKLYRALKAERQRGVSGHWTYDLARHAALLSAWRRERAALGVCSTSRPCRARQPQRKRASAR